jgi:hypothetical protein
MDPEEEGRQPDVRSEQGEERGANVEERETGSGVERGSDDEEEESSGAESTAGSDTDSEDEDEEESGEAVEGEVRDLISRINSAVLENDYLNVALDDDNVVRYGETLLEHGSGVKKLSLRPGLRQRGLTAEGDLRLFLEFVQGSETLETIILVGDFSLTFMGLFFHAVQRSGSMDMMIIGWALIPVHSLRELLQGTTSLTRLDISSCRFDQPEQVSGCLANNETVEVLRITPIEGAFLGPLLSGIGSLSRLQTLALQSSSVAGRTSSAEFCSQVGRLLESALLPKTLCLTGCAFQVHHCGPLARGIRNSRSVEKLRLLSCLFDEGSTNLLHQAFQATSSIQVLEVGAITSTVTKFGRPLGDVLSHIARRQDSSLKKLVFSDLSHWKQTDFVTSLKALEGPSRIECLEMHGGGQGLPIEKLEALVESLPRMPGLRKLEMTLPPAASRELVERFLKAIRRNGSLVEVTVGGIEGDDQAALTHVCERNDGLQQFVASTVTVPLSLWPRIFVRALECDLGSELVFRVLLSVADSVGSSGSGKRRRPPASEEVGTDRSVRRKICE